MSGSAYAQLRLPGWLWASATAVRGAAARSHCRTASLGEHPVQVHLGALRRRLHQSAQLAQRHGARRNTRHPLAEAPADPEPIALRPRADRSSRHQGAVLPHQHQHHRHPGATLPLRQALHRRPHSTNASTSSKPPASQPPPAQQPAAPAPAPPLPSASGTPASEGAAGRRPYYSSPYSPPTNLTESPLHPLGAPERALVRYRELEDLLRIRGYNTLLIVGGCVATLGALIYINREYWKQGLSDNISDVASRSLSDEQVQLKVNEVSRGIVEYLLTDRATREQTIEFVRSLFADETTRTALRDMLTSILAQPEAQRAINQMGMSLVQYLSEDPTTIAALGSLFGYVLRQPTTQAASAALTQWTLEQDNVKKQFEAIGNYMVQSQSIYDSSLRLGASVTHAMLDDPSLQAHTTAFFNTCLGDEQLHQQGGQALWQAFKYSILPTYIIGSPKPKQEQQPADERGEQGAGPPPPPPEQAAHPAQAAEVVKEETEAEVAKGERGGKDEGKKDGGKEGEGKGGESMPSKPEAVDGEQEPASAANSGGNSGGDEAAKDGEDRTDGGDEEGKDGEDDGGNDGGDGGGGSAGGDPQGPAQHDDEIVIVLNGQPHHVPQLANFQRNQSVLAHYLATLASWLHWQAVLPHFATPSMAGPAADISR